MNSNILSLRMDRQHLTCKANESEYIQLYRDMQPGQNVYWNGFGDPPSLTFRADFNDIEFNRQRQLKRELIKGRFAGGNLGWIAPGDLELFAAMHIKPLEKSTEKHLHILELIKREGPMNIQLMKEITGMLVKEITPILHRLQEAFLIYEDQYDGEWDRGWYKFSEMFSDANLSKYTRHQALKIVLQRFCFRHVWFDTKMAKSFYKLSEKDIKNTISELVIDGILIEYSGGYMLKSDCELLQNVQFNIAKSVFVMHRNDFLVKSNEHLLKDKFKVSGNDTLQYILVDGEFRGAVIGHFKNGPYIIEDIILDLPPEEVNDRKSEVIEVIYLVNSREHSPIQKFNGGKV